MQGLFECPMLKKTYCLVAIVQASPHMIKKETEGKLRLLVGAGDKQAELFKRIFGNSFLNAPFLCLFLAK